MPETFFVVIDTNVWISELGLNSALGSSTKFYISSTGATIALPEVIRLEVEQNYEKRLLEFKQTAETNHRQLLGAFGKLNEFTAPTDEEIHHLAKHFFDNFSLPIRPIAFSLVSAMQSLLKTINKEAPSDHDQQFKDGVIWADCLGLLDEADVHLVTTDKAFYAGRRYDGGLAKNLLRECADKPNKLLIHSTLGSLIDGIKRPVDIDSQRFTEAYRGFYNSTVNYADDFPFGIGELINLSTAAYITEQANLSIDFEAEFAAVPDNNSFSAGHYTVSGSCFYDPSGQAFSNFHRTREMITYTQEGDEGETRGRQYVYAGGFVNGGAREARHIVRTPLS